MTETPEGYDSWIDQILIVGAEETPHAPGFKYARAELLALRARLEEVEARVKELEAAMRDIEISLIASHNAVGKKIADILPVQRM